MLPLALVAVALDVGVVLRGKVSQAAKNFIGAAGNEARRDYGPDALGCIRAHGFDLADELGGLLDGLLGRRVAVIVWVRRGVIHHSLTHKASLTLLDAGAGELDRGSKVRAAKVDNGRGAACQKLAHKVPVDRAGKLDVRELGLQREGALEKPTVKRLVKRDARLWPLARMHVQVNKPGKSIASRPQLYKDAGLPVGACQLVVTWVACAHDARNDATCVYLDKRVLEVLERAIRGCVEKRAEKRLGNLHSH